MPSVMELEMERGLPPRHPAHSKLIDALQNHGSQRLNYQTRGFDGVFDAVEVRLCTRLRKDAHLVDRRPPQRRRQLAGNLLGVDVPGGLGTIRAEEHRAR